jgi:hypothetical protein
MKGLPPTPADLLRENQEVARRHQWTVYLGEDLLSRARAVSRVAARRVGAVLGHAPLRQDCQPLLRAGIAEESEAEKLAKGTSGDSESADPADRTPQRGLPQALR